MRSKERREVREKAASVIKATAALVRKEGRQAGKLALNRNIPGH